MKLTKDQKEQLDCLFDETILGAIYEDIVVEPFNLNDDGNEDEEAEESRRIEIRRACADHLIKLLKEYEYD